MGGFECRLSVKISGLCRLSVSLGQQLKMQVNYSHLLCYLRSFKTLNFRRGVKLVIIDYLITLKPR